MRQQANPAQFKLVLAVGQQLVQADHIRWLLDPINYYSLGAETTEDKWVIIKRQATAAQFKLALAVGQPSVQEEIIRWLLDQVDHYSLGGTILEDN